jgi:hypothetical protein
MTLILEILLAMVAPSMLPDTATAGGADDMPLKANGQRNTFVTEIGAETFWSSVNLIKHSEVFLFYDYDEFFETENLCREVKC